MKNLGLLFALILCLGCIGHAGECPESTDAQENAIRDQFQKQADSTLSTVVVEKCEARSILMSTERDPESIRTSTIGHTSVTTLTVNCELYGAHGGSPMSADPIFYCEISPATR